MENISQTILKDLRVLEVGEGALEVAGADDGIVVPRLVPAGLPGAAAAAEEGLRLVGALVEAVEVLRNTAEVERVGLGPGALGVARLLGGAAVDVDADAAGREVGAGRALLEDEVVRLAVADHGRVDDVCLGGAGSGVAAGH